MQQLFGHMARDRQVDIKKLISKNGVKLQFKESNYIFDPKFAFTTQKAFKWCADWPI